LLELRTCVLTDNGSTNTVELAQRPGATEKLAGACGRARSIHCSPGPGGQRRDAGFIVRVSVIHAWEGLAVTEATTVHHPGATRVNRLR
jgi:hypothetical protein